MEKKHNIKLTPISRILRRNMTKEEKKLWYDFLKTLPVPVKRQKIIQNYIVDFFIPCANLVIELDGSQHFEEEHKKADRERDDRLCKLGMTVLRYTNLDILQRFDAVCLEIIHYLKMDELL